MEGRVPPGGRSSSTPTGRSSIPPRWPSRWSGGSRAGVRRLPRPGARRSSGTRGCARLMADAGPTSTRSRAWRSAQTLDWRRACRPTTTLADALLARLPSPAGLSRRSAALAALPSDRPRAILTNGTRATVRRPSAAGLAPICRPSCRPRTSASTSPRRGLRARHVGTSASSRARDLRQRQRLGLRRRRRLRVPRRARPAVVGGPGGFRAAAVRHARRLDGPRRTARPVTETFHLAQLNVALLREPIDSPLLAGFVGGPRAAERASRTGARASSGGSRPTVATRRPSGRSTTRSSS